MKHRHIDVVTDALIKLRSKRNLTNRELAALLFDAIPEFMERPRAEKRSKRAQRGIKAVNDLRAAAVGVLEFMNDTEQTRGKEALFSVFIEDYK